MALTNCYIFISDKSLYAYSGVVVRFVCIFLPPPCRYYPLGLDKLFDVLDLNL